MKSMRIIARFEKHDAVRFVSHLDIQRTFQRAFRRADVPLAYSQGFNPHPQLSFATALSLGYTSDAEWFDVKLEHYMAPETFLAAVNAALPDGFRIAEAKEAADNLPTLTALMAAAKYTVCFYLPEGFSAESLERAFNDMASQAILVEKRTKGGLKTVDIRPMLLHYRFSRLAGFDHILQILGIANASGSLNIDLLMGALAKHCPEGFSYRVHRNIIYSADGAAMPKLPADPFLVF